MPGETQEIAETVNGMYVGIQQAIIGSRPGFLTFIMTHQLIKRYLQRKLEKELFDRGVVFEQEDSKVSKKPYEANIELIEAASATLCMAQAISSSVLGETIDSFDQLADFFENEEIQKKFQFHCLQEMVNDFLRFFTLAFDVRQAFLLLKEISENRWNERNYLELIELYISTPRLYFDVSITDMKENCETLRASFYKIPSAKNRLLSENVGSLFDVVLFEVAVKRFRAELGKFFSWASEDQKMIVSSLEEILRSTDLDYQAKQVFLAGVCKNAVIKDDSLLSRIFKTIGIFDSNNTLSPQVCPQLSQAASSPLQDQGEPGLTPSSIDEATSFQASSPREASSHSGSPVAQL